MGFVQSVGVARAAVGGTSMALKPGHTLIAAVGQSCGRGACPAGECSKGHPQIAERFAWALPGSKHCTVKSQLGHVCGLAKGPNQWDKV